MTDDVQEPGSPRPGLEEVVRSTARLLELFEASAASRLCVSVGAVRWEIDGSATAPAALPGPPATRPVPAEPAGHPVLAPLVGVLFLAPRPGAEPFVRVGDTVRAGQQLAIVEAMKMMNEIVADRAGVVRTVLAPNEAVVEFGEPLFVLDPV